MSGHVYRGSRHRSSSPPAMVDPNPNEMTRDALRGAAEEMQLPGRAQMSDDDLRAAVSAVLGLRRREARAARRGLPRYGVRQQSSGYSFSISYYVYDRVRRTRVSVHAMSREQAQAAADDLNIGDMVAPYYEDPRPYAERRSEAERRYYELQEENRSS